MRLLLLSLALAAGLAAAARADDYDGYDCPQLPPATTTDSQTPAPPPGA
jgi:hypothetical protein